jgi:hypothetical protein
MGSLKTILNPATGRRVLMKGKTGREVQAKMKGKKKKGKAPKACLTKPKSKITKKVNMCSTKRCTKKKGGPVPGRFYGYEGATKCASPVVKRAGKTKNYASRPSARACFDRGDCGPVCYGGSVHVMAFRSNGSPYWVKA